MKTLSKIIIFSLFTISVGSMTSCKDKDVENDEYEVAEDTISTKEELTTSATDTMMLQ